MEEKMELDLEAILKIMDKFDRSEMTEFKYDNEEYTFRLKSEKKQEYVVPSAAPVVVSQQEMVAASEQPATKNAEGTFIKSPLVGTFYSAKAEGEAPFVSVGDTVKKGQVIGIIEAMKLMNEIEAESDGVVAEILVENEQLVEYGQPLIRLK